MRRPLLASVGGFAAGFILIYFAVSIISAYGFGWYDEKWGSPAGAVSFDAEILPIFLLPALLGHGLTLAALSHQVRGLAPAGAAMRAGIAASVSYLVYASVVYAAQSGPRDSLLERAVENLSVGGLLIASIVTTVLAFKVLRRSRKEDQAPAAV